MDKKTDIGATCTWGDGPDVLVTLDGKRFKCYEAVQFSKLVDHGFVSRGSIALTRNEALDLAEQLFRAAGAAKDLDDSVKNYFAAVPQPKDLHKDLHSHLRKKLIT